MLWNLQWSCSCKFPAECTSESILEIGRYLMKIKLWFIVWCLIFLTHIIYYSTQPAYLHSLLNYHTPTHSLHSANANLLSVPRVRTTFASRSFSVAAPAVWNSLPSGIRDSSSTILSVAFLKTASSRPSAHPSASDLATSWHCTL